MKKLLTVFALVLVSVASVVQAQASNPWVGTWTVDIANSKFHGPAPRQQTLNLLTVNSAGLTTKWTMHIVNADGTSTDVAYEARTDGKSYPEIANGKDTIAMTSFHRVSATVYTSHDRTANGSTASVTHTLAKDGKTFTSQEHSTGKDGTFDQTYIWRKS